MFNLQPTLVHKFNQTLPVFVFLAFNYVHRLNVAHIKTKLHGAQGVRSNRSWWATASSISNPMVTSEINGSTCYRKHGGSEKLICQCACD
ncbi:hypothetical protein EVAR_41923_1 [Eumeta japonica]|uniref:Uncharacterized protein n=1 Tax=Eumeta variegata TaxID=151549 RepID=A0A4C1XM99_EUMVA|nr:hypothetical protein EVAR_41923_1 [Eumeta japonica]